MTGRLASHLVALTAALIVAACGADPAPLADESSSLAPQSEPSSSSSEPSVAPRTSMSVPDSTEVTTSTNATPESAPARIPATVASTLCVAASEAWDVDGHSVLVRVPNTGGRVPVVVALHGYKGTPEGLEYYSELTTAADNGSAIVAYPSGGTALDLGFGWNSGSSRFASASGDDVSYLGSLLDRLVELPCADESNVTMLGESNGGGMAIRATCDGRINTRVRQLVLVNAAVDEGVLATCVKVEGAVSVLATAGLLDTVVTYDGSREPFLGVENWFVRVVAVVAGCSGLELTRAPWSPTVEALSVGECSECAVLLGLSDGQHTWPGSFEGVNGSTPGTLEFTEVLLANLDVIGTGC